MVAAHGDFAFKLYGPTSFRLMGDEGRILLEIKTDGTVVGEIEDAGDAAKAFVEALRHQLEPMLRPAVSSLGDDEMVRLKKALAEAADDLGFAAKLFEEKRDYIASGTARSAEERARAAIAAVTG
jgi:hypothetical protein